MHTVNRNVVYVEALDFADFKHLLLKTHWVKTDTSNVIKNPVHLKKLIVHRCIKSKDKFISQIERKQQVIALPSKAAVRVWSTVLTPFVFSSRRWNRELMAHVPQLSHFLTWSLPHLIHSISSIYPVSGLCWSVPVEPTEVLIFQGLSKKD